MKEPFIFELVEDEQIKQQDLDYLIRSLRTYNNQFVSNNDYIPNHILIKDHGDVIGGIISTIYWNHLVIKKIWISDAYQGRGLGSHLLMTAYHKARNHEVKKVIADGYDVKTKSFLESHGFQINSILYDRPTGYQHYQYVNNLLNSPYEQNCPFEVVMNPEHYDLNQFQSLYKHAKKQLYPDVIEQEFLILVKQNDITVGGLRGFIDLDYLYVAILWVDAKYRHLQIGSQLMELAHEHAKKYGITQATVGTTDFHARKFYENLGYRVVGIHNHFPLEYNEYLFTKLL